jgi:hypothetical protein
MFFKSGIIQTSFCFIERVNHCHSARLNLISSLRRFHVQSSLVPAVYGNDLENREI